jgi:hypothetical protein
MKRLFTLAFFLPTLAASAQVLTNDGATITVQAGATLYVDGAVQNKATGTLTNAGTVQLTGDLANAGTLASSGLLLFSGTANQAFTPGASTVAALTLNNTGASGQNTLSLPADLTVSTALVLQNGLLRTAPTAVLTLPDGATLTGEQAGRYVQGNLRAVRTAVSGSAPVDFPNSATLNPNGLSLGTVTVTRTAGLQTAGLSYGQNIAGTNKGIDRVWAVAATGAQPSAATPVTASFSWLADDDNGFALGTNGQLWRADAAAGPWSRMGTVASAASRSFLADVSQFGALTISNISAPLPVELARFSAEAQGEHALLRWATASEKNNDHFDVEASADGKRFSRIGTVKGHGSTTQAQEYQLLDKNIARYAADPVYYRLRQVDTDGTASYSPVRQVRVAAPLGLAAEAWPNPFGGAGATLTVRTRAAGPAALQLHDATGRVLLQRALELPAGTSPVPLAELGELATGTYFLRLTQAGQQIGLKVVRD